MRLGGALLAAVLLVGGCGGGTLGAGGLGAQADTLRSIAAEGGLLAADATDGRTTGVFLRVHGAELADAADAAAGTLASAKVEHGLGDRRARLAALARTIGRDLHRLPAADHRGRAAITARLDAAARESGAIAETLS